MRYNNSMRSRAERRSLDLKKAKRKQKISREVYGVDWYPDLHRYSKGKVHCSCPICATKTNNRRTRVWGPAYNPPASLRRKIDRMNYKG